MKGWDKGGLIISTDLISRRFEFGCTVAFLVFHFVWVLFFC